MDQSPQHYTVLARRFRPQTFEDVVGQEHVGRALRNAIRGGRVAHAYLFTGARGVGKTSTARIFAKALNCPHVVDGVPCNQCEVCQGIGAGNDVDVLEIDGASNRGIDDIRQLRANVNVRSMRSPNKVYIIDEVHMLTKEAFNALLKTLEEPPPNVKFVFCTTEPNKVPDTILSRCQRFDFGTIAASSIMERLSLIAQAEGRTVDDEAMELVARRAAGSMRDSQSLFDQLLAFGNDHITVTDVHKLLGTAPDDRVHAIVDCLIGRNHAGALKLLDEALLQGVQMGSFSDQLLAYFRDLMVLAVGAESVPLSAVTENFRTHVRDQATKWTLESISNAMQILAEAKSRMQRVNYGRALLELALVRIGQLEQLEVLATLIQGLESGGGTAPGASGKTGSGPTKASISRLTPAPATVQPVHRRQELPASVGPTPAIDESTPPASVQEVSQLSQTTSAKQLKSQNVIEFTSANREQFWLRLMAEVTENLAGHLKNTSNTAIFGPNTLEISFPKSYLFSRSYCERPETVRRLGEIARQLTGKSISFVFKTDDTTPAMPGKSPPPPPAAAERRKAGVVENDPFVQSAVAIFGGQVVEVRAVLETSTSATEN